MNTEGPDFTTAVCPSPEEQTISSRQWMYYCSHPHAQVTLLFFTLTSPITLLQFRELLQGGECARKKVLGRIKHMSRENRSTLLEHGDAEELTTNILLFLADASQKCEDHIWNAIQTELWQQASAH